MINLQHCPQGSDSCHRCRGYDIAAVECNDHGSCCGENDKQPLRPRQRKLSLLNYNMFDDLVLQIPQYGWRISWRSRWSNISWENRPEIRGRPTPLKTLSDLVSCFQRSSMAAVRFEDATQRQAQAQAPARGRFLASCRQTSHFWVPRYSQLFPACANLGKPRPEFSDGGIWEQYPFWQQMPQGLVNVPWLGNIGHHQK